MEFGVNPMKSALNNSGVLKSVNNFTKLPGGKTLENPASLLQETKTIHQKSYRFLPAAPFRGHRSQSSASISTFGSAAASLSQTNSVSPFQPRP